MVLGGIVVQGGDIFLNVMMVVQVGKWKLDIKIK